MKNYKPYIALSLILITGITLFFLGRLEDKITIENPQSFNDGWIYDGQTISLPADLDVLKNQKYQVYQILDESFHEPQFLMIRSSLQNVFVYLDDELIYQKTYGESISNPYASMWHFVRLPRHIDGQTLTLEFSSPYSAMSGHINEVFYGSEVMHFTYLYRTYGGRLIIGFLAFIIGLLVMISDFFFTKKDDRGYAFAGLFVIVLSLWMIAESRMIQFFSGSTLLIGSLAYLVIPLVPIPLISYLTEYVLQKHKKPLYVMRYIYMLNCLFVIAMYVLGVMDFFESVMISQVFLLSGIILLITLLIIEIKDLHNQRAIKFIKYLVFSLSSLF